MEISLLNNFFRTYPCGIQKDCMQDEYFVDITTGLNK